MFRQRKENGRDRVSRLISWGHWFAFFNGCLAMIISVRYIKTIGAPESLIGWGYLVLSTLGHFSFLAFIIYLVVIFPITLIMPYSRILRGFAAGVATFSLCILLYDTVIYGDYGLHLNPFVFEIAWADLTALLQGTSYIATPIGIIIIELTAANYLWKRIEKIHKIRHGYKILVIISLCFISSHLIHIWADSANVTEITRLDDAYPLSYPATARTFMENHGIQGSYSRQDKAQRQPTLYYPRSPLQCGKGGGSNLLLVAIDGFRADMVDKKTMPFLTQYAANNWQFNHHFSGGNMHNSGMFSLLYSLQGSYIDAKDLNYQSPLLTQQLKQQGYLLSLFTPKMAIGTPSAIYNDMETHAQNAGDSMANADIATVKAFKKWHAKQKNPWFSLINLQSPASYDTPIGFLGIETVKPKQALKPAQKVLFNQYRQSLNFIDGQLKQLLTTIPKDTFVIITGVSGKAFISNNSRKNLSPSNVRVPLIIHLPNQGYPKVIDYPTNHYSIVPTLMTQLLNCTNKATDYSSGQSLLQPSNKNWTYVGDNLVFGIYQPDRITVIDRHGQYHVYNKNYTKRLEKKISTPELIQVMHEGRRFFNH